MKRDIFRTCTVAIFATLLIACGGGGGSSTPVVTPPLTCTAPQVLQNGICVTPAPTVSVSLSQPKATVGSSVTLTWSSTNATSCTGLDSMTAGALATSGSKTITPTVGGQFTYTIACDGAGGTAKNNALLIVPMPVYPTSYENAKRISIADPNLPGPLEVGITPTATSSPWPWFQGGSAAFADFFQDGSYSAVVQLTQWKDSDTTKAPNAPSRIYFLRKGTNGKWSDATSQLLADTTGCISPRKAVVADFNGDKRPDVFYACHGYDGDPTDPNHPPYGDNQRFLLSQSDGTYRNITLPFVGYGHGASAADLNGDGLPDVVVTNTVGQSTSGYANPLAVTNAVPYVLINKGDGTFQLDLTRLPQAVDTKPETLQYFGIYGLELIDTKANGKPDLFVGAVPESYAAGCWGCARNGVMYNDGTGHFDKLPMSFFPSVQHYSGRYYGGALDFVYANGYIYFQHEVAGLVPTEVVVRKVKLSDFTISIAYSHVGPYLEGVPWPTWLKPDGKGTITSRETGCIYPITSGSVCAIAFPE